jgi:anti-anti-sigma factor
MAPTPVSQLSFDIEKTGQDTFVRCSGRVVSDTCPLFQNTIRELISEGKCIVLDLSNVTHIDSAGLGALVGVWSSAKKRAAEVDIRWAEPRASSSGPDLKIVNLNERSKKLFRLTRLDRLFGGSADQSDAE